MSEQSRLDHLRLLFEEGATLDGVRVAIGDDAAVLRRGEDALVWTVDSAVEGVHFRREWLSLSDIGWRSLMAAASDLAAMGARPRGVLSSLVLPAAFTDDQLDELARGQAAAAAALGTAVIGGNLARGAELSITTTVLGEARVPVLRRGAQVGDVVALAGQVGLARAGLQALISGVAERADLARAVETWRAPLARLDAGIVGARVATAGIDISDGLALDASRLARESGVGIVFDEAALLALVGEELRVAGAALGIAPTELALYGGEDYAVLMTFAEGKVVPPFVIVGKCVAGEAVRLCAIDGVVRDLAAEGFDHFG